MYSHIFDVKKKRSDTSWTQTELEMHAEANEYAYINWTDFLRWCPAFAESNLYEQ